jgi:predicted helicase
LKASALRTHSNLDEDKQLPLFFVEENTERVQREKAAQIMVVIGNPPYNVGQRNENDNNKNRKYPVIDGRIHETYAKASKATRLPRRCTQACIKNLPLSESRTQCCHRWGS